MTSSSATLIYPYFLGSVERLSRIRYTTKEYRSSVGPSPGITECQALQLTSSHTPDPSTIKYYTLPSDTSEEWQPSSPGNMGPPSFGEGIGM